MFLATSIRNLGLTVDMNMGCEANDLNNQRRSPVLSLTKALYAHNPIGKGIRKRELPGRALLGGDTKAVFASAMALLRRGAYGVSVISTDRVPVYSNSCSGIWLTVEQETSRI